MRVTKKKLIRDERTEHWTVEIEGKAYDFEARWLNGRLADFVRIGEGTHLSIAADDFKHARALVSNGYV